MIYNQITKKLLIPNNVKTTSKNSPKLEIKYYKKHLPIVLLELSADVFLNKINVVLRIFS